ncbi:MAG TPA: HAD family hydrolase [Candidatus Wujingus californicus]|uniref:HAD family hydrolase n=1 Tax=Candidatus Wujingus californicus TaxID=3367618 RepID=UPI001DAE36FA|nr:HAD family hydrolase [Planctomycetota bacterium]MDO8132393.1 HAD hydrolase-like protein [Candidatus Brocadiales bacterium]
MINTIFFDFDGVIVESVDIKTKAFVRLFERESEDVVKKVVEYHLNNTGVSRYEKFKYIYKEILNHALCDAELQMLCDKFASLVLDAVVLAPYVKGAKEFLENFVSKYRFFVVTATPQEEIEEIIRRRAINHFFKAVYGTPTKKSDAVREIMDRWSIKPDNALYIGDAMSDYIAARDNSVCFIARINNNESVFSCVNCLKVKDLTELDVTIEKI